VQILFSQTDNEKIVVSKLDSLINDYQKNKKMESMNKFADLLHFNVEKSSISLAQIENQIVKFNLVYNQKPYSMLHCRIDFVEAIIHKKAQNKKAFENKIKDISDKLKISNLKASLKKIVQFNYLLASHLYNDNEIEKAKELFLENENIISSNQKYFASVDKFEIYSNANTLGLIYEKESNSDLSEKYYKIALQRAEKAKNFAWVGLISGNYGNLKNKQKKYDDAEKLFLTDIHYSSINNLQESAIGACIGISNNFLDKRDPQKAIVYADSALYFFKEKQSNIVNIKQSNYNFYKDYFRIKGDAYNTMFSIDSAKYYFNLLSDSLSSQVNLMKSESETNRRKRYEIEYETAKTIHLKKENTQNRFLFLLVFLILILSLLLIFFQWRNNSNLKQQQKQILHQKNILEKINSQKNSFLGILSHDIRGPIINLKELLDLNKKEIIDD
jgi:hypothetical protein